MSSSASPQRQGNQMVRLISLSIVMRLMVDTAMRMFYPYLPEISRGLGISLSQAGLLTSLRTAMILPSPLFGLWNDRHGPRLLLTAALLVQSVCLWWISLAQGLATALLPMLLLGLTAAAFVPTIQAAISEHTPFQRRGRVLGIVEFSWALTGLVILPIVGLLIVERGWQAPFRLFAVLSFSVTPLPLLLPRHKPAGAQARSSLRQAAGLVWGKRSARAAIIVNALMFVAAESFFVTYGAWLEQAFGLAPDQIGGIAGLLGLAELAGSGLSSLIIDRVGKRVGVGAGLVAMTVIMLALPWLEAGLLPATLGLFAFTASFEFSIVSNIGLMSEQAPQARGTMLSLGIMAAGVARTFSAYAGIALFEWRGLPATAALAVLGSGLAALVLLRWVQERAEESPA